jgi:hypothetical protein
MHKPFRAPRFGSFRTYSPGVCPGVGMVKFSRIQRLARAFRSGSSRCSKSLKSPLSACRYSSSCVKSLPFFTSRIQVLCPQVDWRRTSIFATSSSESRPLSFVLASFSARRKKLSFLLVFHRRPVRLRRFGRTRRLQDSEIATAKSPGSVFCILPPNVLGFLLHPNSLVNSQKNGPSRHARVYIAVIPRRSCCSSNLAARSTIRPFSRLLLNKESSKGH